MSRAYGLNIAQLAQIAELERRVLATDGGRLKLEWGVLRGRDTGEVRDLLHYSEEGELLGFLGIYRFGRSLELAGMVDPAARRRGIGTALLREGLTVVSEVDGPEQRPMLICPAATGTGAAFAQAVGAQIDHSEFALVMETAPPAPVLDPRLELRPAGPADDPRAIALLAEGFGLDPASIVAPSEELSHGDTALIVLWKGSLVGYLRCSAAEGGQGGIYGFVIDAAHRGQGIGRQVLVAACRMQFSEGAHRVGLEVAVENERALGLYTSVGFRQVIREDYFALNPRTG